jgi:hypothetical protein
MAFLVERLSEQARRGGTVTKRSPGFGKHLFTAVHEHGIELQRFPQTVEYASGLMQGVFNAIVRRLAVHSSPLSLTPPLPIVDQRASRAKLVFSSGTVGAAVLIVRAPVEVLAKGSSRHRCVTIPMASRRGLTDDRGAWIPIRNSSGRSRVPRGAFFRRDGSCSDCDSRSRSSTRKSPHRVATSRTASQRFVGPSGRWLFSLTKHSTSPASPENQPQSSLQVR